MGTGVGADDVGDDVGVSVGNIVGRNVGNKDGDDVGVDVGNVVGRTVGNKDGSGVGTGDMVGTVVGRELIVGRAVGTRLTEGAGLMVGNDVSIDGSEHHCTLVSAVQLLPKESSPSVEISIVASLRMIIPTDTSLSTVATAPDRTSPSICTQYFSPGMVDPVESH